MPKSQLRKIHNKIRREKIPTEERYYLNKEGETLLRDIFCRLGPFKLSLYDDRTENVGSVQFIDIEKVRKDMPLCLGVELLVADKKDPVEKGVPLYRF